MGQSVDPTRLAKKFGLRDLGVDSGPPVTEFDSLVELAAHALSVRNAAFFVFDDDSGSMIVRSFFGPAFEGDRRPSLSLADAASSDARELNRTIWFRTLAEERPDAVEARLFGASGFVGSPVRDPAGGIAGVLAIMSESPVIWCETAIGRIEKIAHLLSQVILFRASMHTLKLIANERATFS